MNWRREGAANWDKMLLSLKVKSCRDHQRIWKRLTIVDAQLIHVIDYGSVAGRNSHSTQFGQRMGISGKPISIGPPSDSTRSVWILSGFVNNRVQPNFHQFIGGSQSRTTCADDAYFGPQFGFGDFAYTFRVVNQLNIIKRVFWKLPGDERHQHRLPMGAAYLYSRSTSKPLPMCRAANRCLRRVIIINIIKMLAPIEYRNIIFTMIEGYKFRNSKRNSSVVRWRQYPFI